MSASTTTSSAARSSATVAAAGAPRWPLAYVATLLATCTAVAWFIPPTMFSDPGWGFLVWDNVRRGGALNEMIAPDPADISRDVAANVSAWSPAQYLVPGMLEAAGLSLGHAIVVTVAAATALGLAGFHRLFLRLGISPAISALALVVVASARLTLLPFSSYDGGEVLAFGAAPWLFLAIWSRPNLSWPNLLLAAVALFAAIAVKYSLAIPALGAVAGVALREWSRAGTMRNGANVALRLGAACGIALGAAYFVFWSHGWTAVRYERTLVRPLHAALFAFAAPAVNSLSGLDIISRAFHDDARLPISQVYVTWLWVVAGLAVVAALMLVVAWRGGRRWDYRWMMLGVWLATSGAFACFLATQAPLGPTEGRHYRLAGVLIVPGLLAGMAQWTARPARYAAGAIVGLACVYGVASMGAHWRTARSSGVVGQRGTVQLRIGREALAALHEIDAAPDAPQSLVYVTSPEIALELAHARALCVVADFIALEDLKTQAYRGRAPKVFVVAPRSLADNGKLAVILASFVDYRNWTLVELPSDVVCVPAGQSLPPSLTPLPSRSFESPRS